MAAKTKKKLSTRFKESTVGRAAAKAGKGALSYVPSTLARQERLGRKKSRREFAEKLETERLAKKQEEAASAAKDASKGGEIDLFNAYVMDAATKATEWNPDNKLDISDFMKTLTHPEMIAVISHGARIVVDSTGKTLPKSMRSPLEEKEEGGKYGPDMEVRRKKLAEMLGATFIQQDSQTDYLEIIYCAMVGQAGVWDNWEQFDDVHEHGPEKFTLSKLEQLISKGKLDPKTDRELRKYGISAITKDKLIKAIQDATVEFPQEEIDPDYQDVLENTRSRIAQAIEIGSLSQLSSSDLEIVYATLKGEPKHFSPSPKKVFFDMLIKAAIATRTEVTITDEDYWTGTGLFMGSVLKHLVTSITLNKDLPEDLKQSYEIGIGEAIMDTAVADEFIRHGSDEAKKDMFKVEEFLKGFREDAKKVFMAKTDIVVTEHNVPGLGYDELDQALKKIIEASDDLKQALNKVTDKDTREKVADLLKTYKTGVLSKDEIKLIEALKAWIPDALQSKAQDAPPELKEEVERKVKSLMDELLPQVARDLNLSVQDTHSLCTNGNDTQALEALVAYENEHLVERGVVPEDVNESISHLKKELLSRKKMISQHSDADKPLHERQRKSQIDASTDRVKAILDDLGSYSLDGALSDALKNLLAQVNVECLKEYSGAQDKSLRLIKLFEEKHRAGRKKLDPAKVALFNELKKEVKRRNDIQNKVAVKEAEIADLRKTTTDSGKDIDELVGSLFLNTIWPGKDYSKKIKNFYKKTGQEANVLTILDNVQNEAKKKGLPKEVFDSLNELRIKAKEKTIAELKASMPNNLTKIEVLAASLMLSSVDKEKDKLLQDLKAMTDEGKADKQDKATELLEDFKVRMNHPLKKVAKELLKKLSKDEEFLRAGYPPPSEFIIAKNTYRPPVDEVKTPSDRIRKKFAIWLRKILSKSWYYYPKEAWEFLLGKGKKMTEELSNFRKKPFFGWTYYKLKYRAQRKRLENLIEKTSDPIQKREYEKALSTLLDDRYAAIRDNAEKRYKFRAGFLKLCLYAYVGLWGAVSASDWIVPNNRFYKSGMFRPIDGEVFVLSKRNILARMLDLDNWNVYNPLRGDLIEWPWNEKSFLHYKNWAITPVHWRSIHGDLIEWPWNEKSLFHYKNYLLNMTTPNPSNWSANYTFSTAKPDKRPEFELQLPHHLARIENNANGPSVLAGIRDPKHYAENKDDLDMYPRSVNHQLSLLTGVGYILPEEAKPRGEETKEEAYERATEMAEARLKWLKEKNLEQAPWRNNRGKYILKKGIKIPSVLTYLEGVRTASRVSVVPHKKFPTKKLVVKRRPIKDRYILKMDPGLTDRLVNELMKIDPKGTKITLSFLLKNSHIWYAAGYLERSVDAMFYRSCGIRKPEHVDFLIANPELQKYILRLSILGASPFHLVGADKGTADKMLSHMMGEFSKVLGKPNLGRIHIEGEEYLAKLLNHYGVDTHLEKAKDAHKDKPDKIRDKFFFQVEAYLAKDNRDIKEFLDEIPGSERTRLLVAVLYDNEKLKELAVAKHWIENRENVYKAHKIAAERSRLKEKYRLSTAAEYEDAAKKKVSVAEYLRKYPVLEKFISEMWKGESYVVRRERVEQFIRDIMKRHLKKSANLKRIVIGLNPKTMPQGDEAKWAIRMGYITDHWTDKQERMKKQNATQRAERKKALEKELQEDTRRIVRLKKDRKNVLKKIEELKIKIKGLETGWTIFTGDARVAELIAIDKIDLEEEKAKLAKIDKELLKLQGVDHSRIPEMESKIKSIQFWDAMPGAVAVVKDSIENIFKEEVQVGTKVIKKKFRGKEKKERVKVMKTREAVFYENRPSINTKEKVLYFVLEELHKDFENFEMDIRHAGKKSVAELSMKDKKEIKEIAKSCVKLVLLKPKEKPPEAKPSPEKKEGK
jgi:hypothetical protein